MKNKNTIKKIKEISRKSIPVPPTKTIKPIKGKGSRYSRKNIAITIED